MRVLALGDVVGPCGLAFTVANLRKLKLAEKADLVVVNGENLSVRCDIDPEGAEKLFDAGADVITGGNHTLMRQDIYPMLSENDCLLRPANYPEGAPGKGHCLLRWSAGKSVLVINLAGQLFMDPADSPFACCERILKQYEGQYSFSICDFHADATSEKNAFFRCFDGRIQVMFGTHTHVQTADETLLPKGSACMTDLGMCGAFESVIGIVPENAVERFVTGTRNKRELAKGDAALCGAVFDISDDSGFVREVKRIRYTK